MILKAIERRPRLRLRRDGSDGPAQRHGLSGDAAAGTRRPDPVALGEAVDCRRGTTPAAQVLHTDGVGPSDARGRGKTIPVAGEADAGCRFAERRGERMIPACVPSRDPANRGNAGTGMATQRLARRVAFRTLARPARSPRNGTLQPSAWARSGTRTGCAAMGRSSGFPISFSLNVPAPPEGIESFPDAAEALLSSPVRCLSWLAAARRALRRCRTPHANRADWCCVNSLYSRNLVMLSPVERGDPGVQNGFFDPYPSVSREQFESLKAQSAGQFTGLAFYVPARLAVETPNGKQMLIRCQNDRRSLPGGRPATGSCLAAGTPG